MLSLTQLVRTTTGHRTTAKKKKGGHYRTPFWRHLRTLNPYLLLLVLKTTGLNDSDERKSFIVPKTVNLHKLKNRKLQPTFCEEGTEQTGGGGGGKEGRKGGGRRRNEVTEFGLFCVGFV